MEPNFYQILQVERDATPTQIKQAYRKLIKLNHPDRLEASRSQADTAMERRIVERQILEAQQITQTINLAYATLIDVEKRRRYDASLPMPHRTTTATPSAQTDQRPYSQYQRTYTPPNADPRRWTHTHSTWQTRRDDPPEPRKNKPPMDAVATDPPEFVRRIGIFLFVLMFLMFVCDLSLRSFPSEPQQSSRVSNETSTELAQPTFDALNLPGDTTDESTVAIYARQAMNELDFENYDDAIEDLTLALYLAPDSAGLYYLRGLAYDRRGRGITDGDNDLAIADYGRALERNPAYAAALYQRGLIYYDRWRIFGEDGYRRAAVNDLSRFVEMADDVNVDSINAIITQLERSASSN